MIQFNKIRFYALLAFAIAISCNETAKNVTQKDFSEYANSAQNTQAENEVDTLFIGVNEDAQTIDNVEDRQVYTNIRGSQIPAIFQEMYQKAEKTLENIMPEKEPIATPNTYFYDETAIGKYFSQNSKKSEIITFTPSLFEAVSIKGKEGTIITFPPACLVDEYGNPVTSTVQIELKECYRLKDMLFTNLSTTSNELLLQTGGMIYLDATCNGKPLHLMATQPIMIEMPTKEKKDDMELFYGEKRPASGVMNWRVANRKSIENKEDMSRVKDWQRLDELTKIYDIGEVELQVNLANKTSIDGKPFVSFEIKNMNPKLKKYKNIITATLNQVSWEKDQKSKASGKALYEYKQECLLGSIIFTNLEDLLAIREEISKYKNFQFQKTIPLQAHINKDFYYKKVGLMADYIFDRKAFQEDSKFFEENFSRVKEKKTNHYATFIEELAANNEALISSYSAHYAISYLFSSNQMGWLNCDRYDMNVGSRTDLMVKQDNPHNTDIKLILADQRSIIPSRDFGKNIAFLRAPIGSKAVLFGTKLIDDIPYFCLKEIVIGKDKDLELTDFRQMSFLELEQEMIRLGIAT